MLSLPGNEKILSINPIVGETNDGYLNDIRGRHIAPEDVASANQKRQTGPVDEGAVGAGAGTVAFGWKGGIGTASRRLPAALDGYTIGVLVQSNFGGVLTINGAPVVQEFGNTTCVTTHVEAAQDKPDGSCMMVVATDAPIDARNLKRLAARAWVGMGRATEEATYNSMFKATTVTGNRHTIEALPIDRVVAILKEHKLTK